MLNLLTKNTRELEKLLMGKKNLKGQHQKVSISTIRTKVSEKLCYETGVLTSRNVVWE